ncbi:MAG: hypothetical protein R3C04_04150 [Hyphomonas sp.]
MPPAGPIIERVVEGHKGAVKLVKINIDENLAFAGQLWRGRSWRFMCSTRVVRSMLSSVPCLEGQVRGFIDKLLSGARIPRRRSPKRWPRPRPQAEQGIATAAQIYAAIINEEPENVTAIAGLARCYLANGDKERERNALT